MLIAPSLNHNHHGDAAHAPGDFDLTYRVHADAAYAGSTAIHTLSK